LTVQLEAKDGSIDPLFFVKSISLSSFQDKGSARYVAGYANVADIVDSQNDKISLSVLSRAWEKWSKNPDFCILSLEHSNIPIARVEFDEVVDSLGNKFKSGMDNIGLFIVAKLRDDIAIANDVWTVISSGAKKGFSIAGEHLTPPKKECQGGVCYKVPQEIELHEIGIVGHPANQASLFSILKGDDSLFKLAEVVSKITDTKLIKEAVKVSKTPDDSGKYPLYIASFCRAQVSELLTKSGTVQNFIVVDEMCPKRTWINLFDISLSRPAVVKTADDGNVGSNPSSTMNKPTPEVGNMSQESSTSVKSAESPVTLDKLYALVCKLCDKVGMPMDVEPEKVAEVITDVVTSVAPDIALSKSTTVDKPKEVVTTVTPLPTPPTTVEPKVVTVVAPTPVTEVKVTVPEPPQTPVAPVIETPKVEPVVVISPPVAPVAPVTEKGVVTESKVIQRGKIAPAVSTGFDLAGMHKIPWHDITKLRGDS
jgi:hypothetical protein